VCDNLASPDRDGEERRKFVRWLPPGRDDTDHDRRMFASLEDNARVEEDAVGGAATVVAVDSECRFVAEPNLFGESSDAPGREHNN
jgi:hypothetical protein